ncbi:MAG: hypothetical protein IJM59_07545 [Proteobacteria bacterium]|nr:hypothetical protein [Pseudomonadota bacterium]
MPHHQIIIACRNSAESELLRSVIGQPSTPVYHKAARLFDHISTSPGAFLILTPLIMDETASGILTKSAIIHPTYNILYACHAVDALNLLRLYGCGCAAILGPDELNLLSDLLTPAENQLNELVMPPFFIDDDESSLKDPPKSSAQPLHITFLGAQALMSCANALLNITASDSMSMACIAPANPWATDHLISSIHEYTLWSTQTRPIIARSTLTLCHDINALASLEPTSQHFIVCHGMLNDQERAYLDHLPKKPRIFTASDEGYIDYTQSDLETIIAPERLWNIFISALYGND